MRSKETVEWTHSSEWSTAGVRRSLFIATTIAGSFDSLLFQPKKDGKRGGESASCCFYSFCCVVVIVEAFRRGRRWVVGCFCCRSSWSSVTCRWQGSRHHLSTWHNDPLLISFHVWHFAPADAHYLVSQITSFHLSIAWELIAFVVRTGCNSIGACYPNRRDFEVLSHHLPLLGLNSTRNFWNLKTPAKIIRDPTDNKH